ncbi:MULTISPECIES: hypothetical protein [unclassified Aeromicrobium]|uniref:hypothetical protein n=1 Tax=unclassified Aeromicrobium TaxID=2633570 RepID=UPI00396B41F5
MRVSRGMHHLSIGFVPNWSAVGGGWFATKPSGATARNDRSAPPFIASIWRRLSSGHEHAGLPDSCEDLTPVVDRAVALLTESYRPVDFDELDLTLGWTDEESRLEFLEVTKRLETRLRRRLRRQWTVRVSPSPGVVEVTLMGEYMCDWPLWTHDGLSDPDDWTMLSDDLKDRLRAWAVEADPDHVPGPDPVVTEQLLQELRSVLGSRFVVYGLDSDR